MIGSFVILTRKNNSEVFLVKRSDYLIWEIQGGGIEKNESPKQAAIREAKEETGFRIKILSKNFIYLLDNKTTKHVYSGKVVGGKYKPEYKGCEGRWFRLDDLPFFMTAIMRQILVDFINKNNSNDKKDIPNFDVRNTRLLLIPILKIYKNLVKTSHHH